MFSWESFQVLLPIKLKYFIQKRSRWMLQNKLVMLQASTPMLNYGPTRLTTPHWFHQQVSVTLSALKQQQCIPVITVLVWIIVVAKSDFQCLPMSSYMLARVSVLPGQDCSSQEDTSHKFGPAPRRHPVETHTADVRKLSGSVSFFNRTINCVHI